MASFNGVVQQQSPDDMRGRLLALSAVAFLGSTPIGGPVTGVIADRIGAEWSLAYGSFITMATVVVSTIALSTRKPQVPARGTEGTLTA